MRPQRVLGLFLFLVGISALIGEYYWFHTRTFTAYSAPVTLKPGRISTGPFKVNFSGRYYAQLTQFDALYSGRCPGSYEPSSQWVLTGATTSVRVQNDYGLQADLKPGTYELSVEWREDASCLDKYKPHLIISTYSGDAEDQCLYVTWIGAFVMMVGFALFIHGRRSGEATVPEQNISITGTSSFTASRLGGLKRSRFHSRHFKTIPSFGLIASVSILTVSTSWWFMLGAFRYVPRGIKVDIVRPQRTATVVEPDLVIRLNCVRQTMSYFVGGDEVPFAELPTRLKRELAVRADRTVYVDASGDITFQDAVDAIDIVRSAQGRVVLKTGRPKGEAGQCYYVTKRGKKK